MSYRALDNLLQDSKGGITSFPFLLTITDQGMEKPQTQHLCVFFFFFTSPAGVLMDQFGNHD